MPSPDDPDLHPGPHEVPLSIETDSVFIDAIGIYNRYGHLQEVRIDGRDIPVETVTIALKALKVDYPGWKRPLDNRKLWELSDAAFADEAANRWDDRE
jgi:hypothetical protein